jgi:hypothetical protein
MIESEANFHQGIFDDTWTLLNDIITHATARVLANFAGHIHGYYDSGKLFDPQEFADAGQALFEQEEHPTLVLKTPHFYNASYNYKGSQFATAGGKPVITTEAMMVGSNTDAKNGIVRIVSVTEDSFGTWTPEDTAFPSLNPYISNPIPVWGNIVDFQGYAFTKMFSPTRPINYSLYLDGEFRGSINSYEDKPVLFKYQKLTYGTHKANLTVIGYTSDGCRVVESIKKSVTVAEFFALLTCPVDIVITDPAGHRIGKRVNEIPGATYEEVDLDQEGDLEKLITIPTPIDGNYVFTVNGTGSGLYSMLAQFATSQEVVSFNATEIPISLGAVHQYTVNWTALLQGEEGVTVQVDYNGDGVLEYAFTSDCELTSEEFWSAYVKSFGGGVSIPVFVVGGDK